VWKVLMEWREEQQDNARGTRDDLPHKPLSLHE
jgi:hypothetical protein